MSGLLVVTFRGEGDAFQALDTVRRLDKNSGIAVHDFAVVEKDADGKLIHRKETDQTTKAGIVGGGALGLMIGLVFFPVLGLAIGATLGGLIGRSLHHNVDPQLVKDVTNDLTPGTSALFLLFDGSPAALVGAFEPYRGKVYQTNLDADLEAQLNEQLSRGA